MRAPIHHEDNEQFTAEGIARRDAMLGELLGVLKRTHRVRRARRAVATVATVAFAFLAVRFWAPATSGPVEMPRMVEVPGDSPPPDTDRPTHLAAAVVIATVRTDPTIVQRYRAQPAESQVIRLTDQSLLDTLASIHRPAGLIYRDDRVVLSAPVTDEELGLRRVDR